MCLPAPEEAQPQRIFDESLKRLQRPDDEGGVSCAPAATASIADVSLPTPAATASIADMSLSAPEEAQATVYGEAQAEIGRQKYRGEDHAP